MPRSSLVAARTRFQAALLAWYRDNARVLPWREAPSLYKTVVSEFMLQQTQVKTVLPYFSRWLEAFPDFAALAAAPESRVLRLWEGLGYYSRARNLHRLAQAVTARRSPPRTPEAWRELPGVGPYTAAAVTSIAFGAPAACVDGNVVRILARLTANPTAFPDSATAAKTFAPLATALLNPAAPGDHNQAMMELGATVCTKHQPRCEACPAKSVEERIVVRVWCRRGDTLLLHRAASSARRLAGQHELPAAEHLGLTPDDARRGAILAAKTRSITRYRIRELIHTHPTSRVRPTEGLVWVPLAQLETITLSGPHRRWVRELLERDDK
jgi:A/G-specific adenine glycosylase